MATQSHVQRIVRTLPHVVERDNGFGFDIVIGSKKLGFVWSWRERIDPKKSRVVNPDVLVLRLQDLDSREAMLMADSEIFFTESHYDGYAAVLVGLTALNAAQVRGVLTNAHATLIDKLTQKKGRTKKISSETKTSTRRLPDF